MSTTQRIKIIDKKEFFKIATNKSFKIFVIYIAVLKVSKMRIFPFLVAEVAFLLADKALIKNFFNYLDYDNINLVDFAIKLLKYNGINNSIIEQVEDKQLFYWPIYSLNLVKLEILKTYIKIYLKTRFIQLFIFFSKAPIVFDQKLDGSFCLYINY